ncbi:MAG: heavy metal-responsive transcriptional regulator [Methylophilales bacterium 28-44-11]|nr:MAG: heavy metal-responsive transcriptional regulator [Methylophilales bacterium 28-44-11]
MLTIGKVAATAQISTDALRYYEREGLIKPSSISEGGYRLYNQDAVMRLHFIKQAQACGFTLSEIRELLLLSQHSTACCNDVRQLAIEKKLQLEAKIKVLKVMSSSLDAMITNCSNHTLPVTDCPILEAIADIHEVKKP